MSESVHSGHAHGFVSSRTTEECSDSLVELRGYDKLSVETMALQGSNLRAKSNVDINVEQDKYMNYVLRRLKFVW